MEFQLPFLYQGIDVQNFEASGSGREKIEIGWYSVVGN